MTIGEVDPVLVYLKEFRASVSERFDKIEARLDEIDTRLGKVETRLDKIDTRLGKIDTRLGKVETRIDEFDASFGKLDARFNAVDVTLAAINSRFDTMDARISLAVWRLERKLDEVRTELVAHMERLHLELAGRVADMEGPTRGNNGGSALTN